ncbi:MAG TPA: hypothetical protein VF544_11840 [Pyrinomonadaceae bacterium]|jgi:hypothetical protein
MRHTVRLVIALLTFGIGIAAFAAWAGLYHFLHLEEQIIPVAELRQNELHRFYEAAAMSGDSALRQRVTEGLMCMGHDGLIDAHVIDIENVPWCIKANRTRYRMRADYYSKFMSEHKAWTQENLSFLNEVNTPVKAKEYAAKHGEPLLAVSPNSSLNPSPR